MGSGGALVVVVGAAPAPVTRCPLYGEERHLGLLIFISKNIFYEYIFIYIK